MYGNNEERKGFVMLFFRTRRIVRENRYEALHMSNIQLHTPFSTDMLVGFRCYHSVVLEHPCAYKDNLLIKESADVLSLMTISFGDLRHQVVLEISSST